MPENVVRVTNLMDGIEILKEATKIETKAGDTNTYNVKVKNNGTYDARDVVVEDILYRRC